MYKEETTTYYGFDHWDAERARLSGWFAQRANSWNEDLAELNYKPRLPGPSVSVLL